MRKIPWGIIAGICAMGVVFATVAVVALYIVFNGIAAQTNDSASFFGEWYQTAIFIADIIFACGFVTSLVLYILKLKGKFGKQEIKNEDI